MTVADLREVLARQRGTDDVVVAGHGRLLFVTHAATEGGAPVCVLYVDYPQQGYVGLTDAGRNVAQIDDAAPTTSAELQRAICAKLPAPQARIVRVAADFYPKALARDVVAEKADASVTSSAFMNNLGALRSLGLIEYPATGLVAASPVLFLDGAR